MSVYRWHPTEPTTLRADLSARIRSAVANRLDTITEYYADGRVTVAHIGAPDIHGWRLVTLTTTRS